MKTNKKVWIRPVVGVQMFAPQEYIAGCSTITGFVDYKRTRRGLIFLRYEYGYYDEGEDFTSGICNSAENGSYENIDVYQRYSTGLLNYHEYDNNIGHYGLVVIKDGKAYNNFS